MTSAQLIQKLGRFGIKLWLDDGQLKFKAPKGALTPDLKAELIENKGAVIKFLADIDANHAVTAIRVLDRKPGTAYPLSFAQQRFWFLDQLQTGDPSLHIPTAIVLEGDVNLPLLEQAFNALIRRHESLRTYFCVDEKNRAQQFISDNLLLKLQEDYDLSHLNAEQAHQQLIDIAKEEALKSFDLNSGESGSPLFLRCKLARLAVAAEKQAPRVVLFITLHHIICDGISLSVMIQQLSEYYSALINGQPVSELNTQQSIQYIDYSQYQIDWMQSKKMALELDWWKQHLNDTEVLHLPYDFSRPLHVGHHGNKQRLLFSTDLSRNINAYALEHKTSSFIFLLSIFQLLLNKYSKQDNFCIGTPVHGRSHIELQEAVGCFINLLALPCQIDSVNESTPQSLIQATHEFFMQAQENQTIPFDVLAEEIDYDRSSSHTPIFQVLFTQQAKQTLAGVAFTDLEVNVLEQASYTSKYDLQLHVNELEDQFELTIEYNSDLFSPETIATLLRHFATLSASVIENAMQLMSELQIIDAIDLQTLNIQKNLTDISVGENSLKPFNLIHSFDHHVRVNPNAIAVDDGVVALSYQQLFDESMTIADRLKQQGLKAGDKVGLCFAPNQYAISSLMACLRLSLCYVPMDVNYPAERLRFIVDDAALHILLTESQFSEQIEVDDKKIIAVDQLSAYEGAPLASNVTAQAEDSLPLYIIYTSGSTGTPKGAVISYANEKHLLDWFIQEYDLDENSKTLIISSLGFDLTQKNLLGPLMVGGGVYFTASNTYDPLDILASIDNKKINRINCAPSAFYPVLAAAKRTHHLDHLSHLQYVLLGGESIVMGHFSEWLNGVGSHVTVVNMYGPTECTDITCAYRLSHPDETSVPIGYAIPGVECLVLDEQLNILPVGMSGELYIGGQSLGLGYLNNDALNNEAFIVHPLDANRKIYRTKDIVRYKRSDKGLLLEFIARADDQVKIRGFRIELDEITNQLLLQTAIKAATVIVSSVDGQDKLVAYLVLENPECFLNLHELRQQLKQYLPDYMLPNAFVELSQLPLSANGKVDKKQLPAVNKNDFLKREYVSARNLVEAQLVEIWQDILQTKNISVYDNFFELGGHSLLATQMVACVAEEFSIEIKLKDFFDKPTIAECADSINSGDLVEVFSTSHPIVAVDRHGDLPLSFAQERLWVIEQISPGNSAYNIPVALHLTGHLNIFALEQTLQAIVNRHESLRTNFSLNEAGEAVQSIGLPDTFKLQQRDVSTEAYPMQAAQRLFDSEAAIVLDIASDALFKAVLVKLSINEYVLVAIMHHIISDGWSINILQKELVTYYASYCLNEAVEIDALPFQYADFSVWQRDLLSDDHIRSHLNFWQQELAGIPAHITLPIDKPRPNQQTFNGAIHKVDLAQSLVHQLRTFAQQQAITPFTLLLTAYALMLSKFARQDDICIGTPVAGREQKSLESLIGYFVNAVVLRCQLDGNPSFIELIERFQETSLMAFANQAVPLEKVLDVVELERNPAYSPVSQVGFSYIGQEFTVKAKLPELEVDYVDFNSVVAKYDLTLIIIDDGESIRCEFEYNTDLFHAQTIEYFSEQFASIVDRAIASPTHAIHDILALTFEQRCSAVGVAESAVETILPLTPMQRDMVFSQLMTPSTLANTLGYRAEVAVDIQSDIWRQAFQCVSDRHSICRTVFKANQSSVGDDYYQCVLKEKVVDFECIDLRGKGVSEQALDTVVNTFIYQPNAYLEERFMRVAVIKYDNRDLLLLSSHHALLDGVSIVLIAQATATFYEALMRGDDVDDQPILPENFSSYVQETLSKTDSREVKNFWQKTLLDCEPIHYSLMRQAHTTGEQESLVLNSFEHTTKIHEHSLQLADYVSQKVQRLTFSDKHWLSIKSYCRSHRITPPQYFKLLYCLLISQYCNANHKFSITEFSAGRNKMNGFSLGCFFKQSPFVFDAESLTKDTEITELFQAQRTFRKNSKGLNNISASLSAALQSASSLQFMFNYYHFFPTEQVLQGQPIACIEMPPFIENAVQFIVKEQNSFVSLDLYFQDVVFEDLDFLGRLEMLSAQLVQQADTLNQLSYLLPIEFIQQVYQWNKIEEPTAVMPLAAQFEQQVVTKPSAIALVDGVESLTYKALNDRANVIAHQLQTIGVGANVRVAFCLPRCSDALTIILAVIKLGATYVPIDDSYPSERIALIAKAAAAKVLFTRKDSAIACNDFSTMTLFIEQGQVDGLGIANISTASVSNLSIEAHADDMLYIIFTSGSTGVPKGAAVSYANEINLLQWYSHFGFNEARACVFSPLGFDLTQKNLLAPLLSGGQLVLVAGQYDSEAIIKTIKEQSITHINCAPSLFYPLVEDYAAEYSIDSLSSLEVISFGGEPIQLSRLKPWVESAAFDGAIYNHYGPTECTDIALYHKVDIRNALDSNYIPLGKPNTGVQVFIMNERLQLLPPGVTGEICIAGKGVGLGYINDEVMTLDNFVSNPLGVGKIYKTGDLGRYDDKFDIEFIGRKDYQLKLNGLRIEPGEIEFQLSLLDGVQGALVQVVDEQLVAYVLNETSLLLSDVLQALSDSLPAYMLPKHLVCMSEWPLTANGKIDRAKLPEPLAKVTVEYVPPSNAIEKDLCEILEHVLAVSKVGIYDNFFDLGGHSLAASRAIVQVRQRYQIDIPLNVLFEMSTVEKLAAWISASQWAVQSAAEHNSDEEGRDSGFI